MKYNLLLFNMCSWKSKGIELKIVMQNKIWAFQRGWNPLRPQATRASQHRLLQPQTFASPPLEDRAKGGGSNISDFASDNIQRTKLEANFKD